MPVEVKICGLSTLATVDAALDAGADLIGLIFYPRSPRHVSEQRPTLADRARGRAKIVAVMVDAPDAALRNRRKGASRSLPVSRLGIAGARAKSALSRESPSSRRSRSELKDIAKAADYAGKAALFSMTRKRPKR